MAVDTASTTTGGDSKPCPDPSVHERQHKLSEQASTAALYVTSPHRKAQKDAQSEPVLDPDGKLSSKGKCEDADGAAASLKYAKAQDLPSFPSHGVNTAHSAGQAANLAKDYKMKDLWQPELSSAGSKAALLAHQKGANLDLWQPSPSEAGNSAAALAFRNQKSVELDRGYTPEGKQKALLAATKSHHDGRRRAGSTPAPVHPAYPDSHNSSFNALNAATVSHRQGSVKQTDSNRIDSDAMQAARIKNSHMDPQLFTEHPDIGIGQQERKHEAALRASAVSMAKDMYDRDSRSTPFDGGAGAGAGAAHSRAPGPTVEKDLKQEAMRYIHLQEAAHRLASERLAKVEKDFEYRRKMEYYGYDTQPKKSRLSMRGRTQANSEPARDRDGSESDSDDERQARRIRTQMSQLNTSAATVDAQKQQSDRAALIAAAQKRVSDRMSTLDERVFADTGKVSDSMLESWEAKARAKAEADKEERTKNFGKTHVGGGKFMDMSEIEAIALARLKPTLNDIDKTAEEKRARDEELRLEKEAQLREKNDQKQKDRDEKAEAKQVKAEQKAAKKADKDAEKARKADEKQKAKEDKQRSKDAKKDAEAVTAASAGALAGAAAGGVGATAAAVTAASPTHAAEPRASDAAASPTSPASPTHVAEPEVDESGEDPAPLLPSTEQQWKPKAKPNLERHISHIRSSDSEDNEDSDDDDEWDAAPTDGKKSIDHTPAVAESSAIPIAAVTPAPATVPAVPEPAPATPELAPAESEPAPIKSEPATTDSEPAPLKTQKSAESDAQSPKKKGGMRSFFGFGSRRKSKSEREPGKISSSGKGSVAEPASAAAVEKSSKPSVGSSKAPDETERMGIDGPIGVNNKVSGVDGSPEAASPSSFRKRDGSLSSVSSLSSSGVEEDDFERGRTGRMKKALGLGGSKSKGTELENGKTGTGAGESMTSPLGRTKTNDSDNENDNDAFEEAQDHFDEPAPQPAFAGQQKHAGSPSRGTKFKEEV